MFKAIPAPLIHLPAPMALKVERTGNITDILGIAIISIEVVEEADTLTPRSRVQATAIPRRA